jgi:hypothetical protein
MDNKDKLSEQVVHSKSFEETPPLEKKSSRVLILTLLSALFILSVLLVLFLTGVLSRDNLVMEGKCEYMGEIYSDGETFPLGDGCNSCFCDGDTGEVICTNMPCIRNDLGDRFEEGTEEGNYNLPLGIYQEQVYKEFAIGTRRFLVYQRPNMNVPIYQSNNESGVLYALEGDIEWNSFIKVRELGESKNNVFFFDYDFDLDGYVIFLIDANGAGSGEGIAKLISSVQGGDSWDVLNCFYYMPEDWIYDDGLSIREEVEQYIKDNPQYIQDMTDINCRDFEIVDG